MTRIKKRASWMIWNTLSWKIKTHFWCSYRATSYGGGSEACLLTWREERAELYPFFFIISWKRPNEEPISIKICLFIYSLSFGMIWFERDYHTQKAQKRESTLFELCLLSFSFATRKNVLLSGCRNLFQERTMIIILLYISSNKTIFLPFCHF